MVVLSWNKNSIFCLFRLGFLLNAWPRWKEFLPVIHAAGSIAGWHGCLCRKEYENVIRLYKAG
jgi:hypothetical protein